MTAWIIGWMFTVGIIASENDSSGKDCFILSLASIVIWPFILGLYYAKET